MPFPDLQTFLNELDRRGQLKRVGVAVDPILEIAEIADRVSKSPAAAGIDESGKPRTEPPPPPQTDPVHGKRGGHALLFENVKGSSIPCAINTFGSYERVRLALGCDDLEDLAGKVQQLVKPEIPTTLLEKMKKLPELAKMAGFGPKVVRSGMCQQVVKTGDDVDLHELPIIQCWPHDGRAGYGGKPARGEPRTSVRADALGDDARNRPPTSARAEARGSLEPNGTGKYITFAGMYTRCPETGTRNVGMYRAQLFGPRLTAMHWHMHHDGARHHRRYANRGQPTPLAIVLGGEPVLPYAATCPLPPDVSELLFAGFLNGKGIELVPCKTIDMDVPANAEIVIEGLVHPTETLMEGPFGDHTGFYSLADRFPRFDVTAITHRRDPVYPTTIVGKPPQEDYYLGKATERIFLPLLRILIPDAIDYHLPMFGAFHNCVFVKIAKEYPMQARKVIHSIWGAGQMMFSKMIVVVDENVNVHDEQDVLFHVGANVDWRRDTVIADGPCDILDHATPYLATGAKIGIDATRKIAGEGTVRAWPDELEMSEAVKQFVDRSWSKYGLP